MLDIYSFDNKNTSVMKLLKKIRLKIKNSFVQLLLNNINEQLILDVIKNNEQYFKELVLKSLPPEKIKDINQRNISCWGG